MRARARLPSEKVHNEERKAKSSDRCTWKEVTSPLRQDQPCSGENACGACLTLPCLPTRASRGYSTASVCHDRATEAASGVRRSKGRRAVALARSGWIPREVESREGMGLCGLEGGGDTRGARTGSARAEAPRGRADSGTREHKARGVALLVAVRVAAA